MRISRVRLIPVTVTVALLLFYLIHVNSWENLPTLKMLQSYSQNGHSCGCLHDMVVVWGQGTYGSLFLQWASAIGLAKRLHQLFPDDEYRSVGLELNASLILTDVFDGFEATSLRNLLQYRTTPNGHQCVERINTLKTCESFPYWGTLDDLERVEGGVPVILPVQLVIPEVIAPIVSELPRRIRFRHDIREPTVRLLRTLSEYLKEKIAFNTEQVVFVGIHARRTLSHRFLDKDVGGPGRAEVDYYVRALDRLLQTLRLEAQQQNREISNTMQEKNLTEPLPTLAPVIIVVASDNMQWTKDLLVPKLRKFLKRTKVHDSLVHAGGVGTPFTAPMDLALLSHCNHSIISYGAFGTTAALLAGGRVIAYDVGQPEYSTMVLADHLPNWMVMR